VIDAAYGLFAEQGFHATPMREIAQRAGVSVGVIYNHFSTKDKIFDKVLLEKHPYREVFANLQPASGDTLEDFCLDFPCSLSRGSCS
jgi:AcrR family transcriptional regulator